MSFATPAFFLFFAIVFGLYVILQRRYQNALLLVASYVFYATFDWRFCILLLALTSVTYLCGQQIFRSEEKKAKRKWMWISVIINLGTLCLYKYFDTFESTLHQIIPMWNPGLLQLAIPIGLSFIVFQTMGYAIDLYRGSIEPSESLAEFALYIAFFPKILAGPIERAQNFLPQLREERTVDSRALQEGLYLFAWGYYQKFFVSSILAGLVDTNYANLTSLTGLESLISIYGFAFQLYADFAGYTNMARGFSKMLGFNLVENFRTPFFAENVLEFWKRWHMSLTTWLRDYVYFPFYFQTKNLWLATMLVFILNGAWHGATFNFVIMGVYWGIVVAITTWIIMQQRKGVKLPIDILNRLPATAVTIMAVLFTFHLNCLGFLFFRSATLTEIGSILSNLVLGSYALTQTSVWLLATFLFSVVPMLILEFIQYKKDDPLVLLNFTAYRQFLVSGLLSIQVLSAFLYSPELLSQDTSNQTFVYCRF